MENCQYLPVIPYDTAVINFTYTYAIITSNIITIIILNSYGLDYLKTGKNKRVYFPVFAPSLKLSLSLCRSIWISNFLILPVILFFLLALFSLFMLTFLPWLQFLFFLLEFFFSELFNFQVFQSKEKTFIESIS